ncbi:hypothetical protein [Abiotrophia defectiva]
MGTKIHELADYFTETLVPRYEVLFKVSLEDAIFWDPLTVLNHPEHIEEAIRKLEQAIITGEPLNDIQYFNPDVIY